jgi:hypothetical protein
MARPLKLATKMEERFAWLQTIGMAGIQAIPRPD